MVEWVVNGGGGFVVCQWRRWSGLICGVCLGFHSGSSGFGLIWIFGGFGLIWVSGSFGLIWVSNG